MSLDELGRKTGVFRLGAFSVHAVLAERVIQGLYTAGSTFAAAPTFGTLGARLICLVITLSKGRSSGSLRASQLCTTTSIVHVAIACCSVLSVFCQYEALRQLSFTTVALVQCLVISILAALPPRRALGGLLFGGLGLIIYWYSHRSELFGAQTGVMVLIAHALFETLASLVRSRGLGEENGGEFLDRMIGEVIATLLALVIAIFSVFKAQVFSSLELLSSPLLIVHLCLLCLAGSLIVNIPPSTSSRMVAIPLNAAAFGEIRNVTALGWMGVAYVAAGLWLQVDLEKERAISGDFIPLNQDEDAYPMYADRERMRDVKGDSHVEIGPVKESLRSQSQPISPYVRYLIAVLAPLALGAVVSLETDWTSSEFDYPLTNTPQSTLATSVEVTVPISNNETEPETLVEGGLWAHQFHSSIDPVCTDEAPATRHYDGVGRGKTALATFPRSGNSYIRGLIERSTGFRTSSVYCDYALSPTFKDECNHNAYFLVKTHYPSVRVNVQRINNNTHWEQFDQILYLVRNPLDVIFSYYNVIRGNHDHTYRVADLEKFGPTHRNEVLRHAANWVKHARYWSNVPRRTHQVRYEDLRDSPLPNLMAALSFFMAEEDLPSLNDLGCAIELHVNAQAYNSRKVSTFDAWDKYEDDLRLEVLKVIAAEWCRFGYEDMAKKFKLSTGIDCFEIASNNRELIENGDPTGGQPNTRSIR